MIVGEAQANSDTVSSTMIIFGTPAQVLFYSRSSRSFVSSSFALHADRELLPLKHKVVVMTFLGEQIFHNSVFKGCEILIEGVVLKANLIPLEMWDFDIILGMIGCPLTELRWIALQRKLCFRNLDFQSWYLKVTVEFWPLV